MIHIKVLAAVHRRTNEPSVNLLLDRDGDELGTLVFNRDELTGLVESLVVAMHQAEKMAEEPTTIETHPQTTA